MPTKIEWAEETWNPVTGCNKVDESCRNCYAERMAKRLAGRFGYPADDPFRVTLHPGRLDIPQHWKKPRKIFVNSMSDLFHPAVPNGFVKKVYYAMACAPQHQYMILTKRPDRMLRFISCTYQHTEWPQVWLGVSVHDQKSAEERIPILLQTPAVKRFVSYEPALGAVDFTKIRYEGLFLNSLEGAHPAYGALNLVICGGESGPGARPMHPDWARSARNQCQAAGVDFVFKQWGAYIECSSFDHDMGGVANDPSLKINDPKLSVIPMKRVGKKAAGRTLDRTIHDGGE